MKNLGILSRLLLLALLAGAWSWTGRTPRCTGSVRKHADAHPQDHPERGDVPGWVMITLMSAVLVAGLLALAGPALETMFNQAMDRVGK
ncbi:hypothetical protein ACS5PJ_19930 [Pseudarthrobacter sp. YS3]|jgi:hypothetical protein|uniref:hypothetical protein n=1 Tax=Pseudarthrobacter sp. YS3 TaxID=3453718 RepID=UPI003EEE48E3